jgi:hypothetical protein
MEGTFYPANDYRFYLEHHGVKGMRWGVRRYRNADGSLSEEGRKHYKYGDISITKSPYDDAPVPTVIVSNGRKQAEISDRSLYKLERLSNSEVVKMVSTVAGVRLQDIQDFVESDDALVEAVHDLFEKQMNTTLSQILAEHGSDVKSPNGTRSSSEQNSSANANKQSRTRGSAPKYTQEQAIAKGYSDLEKKYPNFNDFDQDTQDKLWMNYMNESGLYRYV